MGQSATHRPVYLRVETNVQFGVPDYLKRLTHSEQEKWLNVWGTSMLVLVMGCLCECVSLCVYAANGGLI